MSCVPGHLTLFLLHRCWFSRTRFEAEESSTVPKKTLVQSLDLCCLSGQCFVLKSTCQTFYNSFWNLPGTHLFTEMTTPAMLDASKMAPSEAGCCFPNLTTCILCTVASCKKDHDFPSKWSKPEALCGVQVRKPSDKAKAGWVSLGESGFPVQIQLDLEVRKPTFSSGKGCRRKGSLKVI